MKGSGVEIIRYPDTLSKCNLFTTVVSTPVGSTVLSAKSDSDIMFCLQSHQGLIIDRSPVYQQDIINIKVIYRFALAQVECTRYCCNKIYRHCHSWLARQYREYFNCVNSIQDHYHYVITATPTADG